VALKLFPATVVMIPVPVSDFPDHAVSGIRDILILPVDRKRSIGRFSEAWVALATVAGVTWRAGASHGGD